MGLNRPLIPGRWPVPLANDHRSPVFGRPQFDRQPLATPVTPLDMGAQAGPCAEDRQGQFRVEIEVRVPERIRVRFQEGLVRVQHDDMHVAQRLARISSPHRHARREAVGKRRTGRWQGDLELAFSNGFEDRHPSSERDRLLLDDTDSLRLDVR